ncbi:MAG: TraR/DksA C4-type zinc finger protein [Chitinophagaceae bacterium]|nr:TraR/DksA C4-type zinc finger protein [Chitinophagaceae bacterium]
MANKKKPAPKKAAKPAPKAAAKKPAAKKTVKKSAPKPAPKKAAKPAPKKPAAKPAPKAAAKPAPKAAAKPAPKVTAQPVAKPVAKVAEKPEPPVQKAEPVKTGKPGQIDPKSLVSIKPKVQPVIKKEPPKPSKVVIPKTTTKSSVKYEPEFTKSVLDASAINYAANGPTMRYSDADLQEFREIIQKKLDAAKKELNYLQGLITRKEEGGDMDEGRYMTMEDGSVSMEREQLSQMASRQITFIDHLEKAMMRIENKTYGICRVTGKLIDKARLRAVPHATLSIEAKQMMNK